MFQKIANVLSIISFVMVASMSGGAYFGYKYELQKTLNPE